MSVDYNAAVRQCGSEDGILNAQLNCRYLMFTCPDDWQYKDDNNLLDISYWLL